MVIMLSLDVRGYDYCIGLPRITCGIHYIWYAVVYRNEYTGRPKIHALSLNRASPRLERITIPL